jgi:hypothetical protein
LLTAHRWPSPDLPFVAKLDERRRLAGPLAADRQVDAPLQRPLIFVSLEIVPGQRRHRVLGCRIAASFGTLVAILAMLIKEGPKDHRHGLMAIIYNRLVEHLERIGKEQPLELPNEYEGTIQ